MIYAVKAIGTEYIKFGKAKNVDSRLRMLQSGCPFDLMIVATADWPDSEEWMIHNYLEKYHVRGEWFMRTTPQAAKVIQCMQNDKDGLEQFRAVSRPQDRQEPSFTDSELFRRLTAVKGSA